MTELCNHEDVGFKRYSKVPAYSVSGFGLQLGSSQVCSNLGLILVSSVIIPISDNDIVFTTITPEIWE